MHMVYFLRHNIYVEGDNVKTPIFKKIGEFWLLVDCTIRFTATFYF